MPTDEVGELLRSSRARQGLPPTVEDPVAIGRLAKLLTDRWRDTPPLRVVEERAEEGHGNVRSAS